MEEISLWSLRFKILMCIVLLCLIFVIFNIEKGLLNGILTSSDIYYKM